MISYNNSIGKIYSVSFFILLSIILIANIRELQASECVLKLQNNKNAGTTIINNVCEKNSELSLNALLEVKEGARLWLESTITHKNSYNYWLICQNFSSTPIRVVISSEILPWINPANLKCNKLPKHIECFDTNVGNKALFCATGRITKTRPEMERTTSVPVRVGTKDTLAVSDLKAFLEPRINLCRSIFSEKNLIKLILNIKASGEITEVIFENGGTQKQFDDCVTEGIKDSSFPLFAEDTQISIFFE